MTDFNTLLEQFDNLAGFGGDTPTVTSKPPVTDTPKPVSASVTDAFFGSLFSFSTRLVAILLGLIFIAGAIYLFKGPEIIETVKSGAKAAAVA